jgi:hypothetical protein
VPEPPEPPGEVRIAGLGAGAALVAREALVVAVDLVVAADAGLVAAALTVPVPALSLTG